MKSIIRNESGISLVELLVALGIGAIVSLALFISFTSQHRLYQGEQRVTQMVSAARVTMDEITKSVRLAGLNPSESTSVTFGIKDNSTSFTNGTFADTTIANSPFTTGNTQISFTSDYNEDGALANDSSERIAYKWAAAAASTSTNPIGTIQVGVINGTTGAISSWADKWSNVTSFGVVYSYKNGETSGAGTLNVSNKTWTVTATSLPSDSVANHNYDDIAAVTLFLSMRTDLPHDMTQQYFNEPICSTVLLRNATLTNKTYGTITTSPCQIVW